MKKILGIVFSAVLVFSATSCGFKKVVARPTESDIIMEEKGSIYDFTMESIDGQEISLSKYKGSKILIVNTASECGFTPQYEGLQELNKMHGDKVVILGFPANNFGGQEPGTDLEIKTFCQANYGVTFQMFSKISVKGDDMHPLYQWLSDKNMNGWNDQAPKWNFCKYLVNEKGELVKYFASGVDPMGDEILGEII